MVGMTQDYLLSAVDLLNQHGPRHHMRPGLPAEGEDQIGGRPHGRIETVRAADDLSLIHI